MFLPIQHGLLLSTGPTLLNISYTCHPTCIPSTVTHKNFVLDGRSAFLNLDLVNAFVEPIATRDTGREWISSVNRWIEALRDLDSPLIIFAPSFPGAGWQDRNGRRLRPEIGDVVLQKTGYSADAGNSLEQILHAQRISTVVLSGIRTGGVVASTAYRLSDLGYKVYIIANNTIEVGDSGFDDNAALLSAALPKLPVDIITLNQALQGLQRALRPGDRSIISPQCSERRSRQVRQNILPWSFCSIVSRTRM
ncbi:hypothetical protein D0869_06113 [Hortaea werneckii]|uniref:Isochorismatase-like domain-containing protein n=1 Tax=Hortaea werneckii TaxID=91943 RepID=A0A3M6WVV1_HORWE|nr:hypothetical protein D0869_06113 [Hortaea werneckii]